MFVFRQVEDADQAIALNLERAGEAIAPNVGKRAGDGDGDVDGTTSGGGIHSMRVKAALLAIGSQHLCQTRRSRNNLPMSSRSPICYAERPFGTVRHRRRRGRLKVEAIKVSQTAKVEMTYLGCTGVVQPCRNISKSCCGAVGPWRRHGRIEIEPAKLKIERVNDKSAQEVKMTYRICARAAQPPVNAPKCRYGVYRPIRRHSHIKTEPRNVSRMRNAGRTYLVRVDAIRLKWRPKKLKGRSQECLPWTHYHNLVHSET